MNDFIEEELKTWRHRLQGVNEDIAILQNRLTVSHERKINLTKAIALLSEASKE